MPRDLFAEFNVKPMAQPLPTDAPDYLDVVTGGASALEPLPALANQPRDLFKEFNIKPKKKQTLGENILESTQAFGTGVVNGATGGFLDEAVGAIGAGVDKVKGSKKPLGESYRYWRDAARKDFDKLSADNKVASIGGDVMGSIFSPINKLVGAPGGLVKTIGQGAALGGAQGLGRSEADVVNDPWKAAIDTAIGAGAGGATGGVLYGVGKGISALAGKIATAIKGKGAPDPATQRAVQIMLDEGKTPRQILEAAKASKASQKTVPSTVFEQAESPVGTSLQRTMTEQPSAAGTYMQGFNKARVQDKLPGVVEKTIYKGATTTSPVTAAENIKTAANDIITSAVKTRSARVKPLYDEIAPKKIPPNLMANLIKKSPILEKEIVSAAKDPVVLQLAGDLPPNSIGFLDAVKKSLDGKIGVAQRAGDRTTVAAYQQAKTALLEALDGYAPGYAKARAEFEGMSPVVTRLKESLVGKIANAKDAKSMAGIVFRELPDNIKQARNIFHKTGKGQQWDDLVASYVGNLDDSSTGSVQSLITKLNGNKIVQRRMQAAMGDQAYAGHRALIRNLERIQQGMPRNSETVPKAQAAEMLMEGAGNSRLTSADPRGAHMRILDWIGNKIDASASKDAIARQNARNLELAKVITSPDLAQYAKAIRGLTPKQQIDKTIIWLDARIGSAAGGEGTGYMNKPNSTGGTVPKQRLRITIRPSDKEKSY